MGESLTQSVFFIGLIIGIYFISRKNIQIIGQSLLRILKNQKITIFVLSMLYFPGTFIHESAHMAFALLLALRIHSIHLLPSFEENTVRLGSVVYERKDPFRGILIGIAPLVVGVFSLWLVQRYQLFPSQIVAQTVLFAYLIFTVSSTMFPSKRDLADGVYLIPLVVILFGVLYIFSMNLLELFRVINSYLTVAFLINVGLFLSFGVVHLFTKR